MLDRHGANRVPGGSRQRGSGRLTGKPSGANPEVANPEVSFCSTAPVNRQPGVHFASRKIAEYKTERQPRINSRSRGRRVPNCIDPEKHRGHRVRELRKGYDFSSDAHNLHTGAVEIRSYLECGFLPPRGWETINPGWHLFRGPFLHQ